MKKSKISKDQLKFKHMFYELMFHLDLYNKFYKTYFLQILNETEYGFYAHLYLVAGLSFEMLAEKRIVLEQNLRCLWIMKPQPFKEYAEVMIVTKPVDADMEYEPPKLKPYEMYLGLSLSKQIIKINCNERCMFLFSGATGTGKTRFMYMVLLSWILSCSPDEVWLFISDIAKDEYINFKHVKHVKWYASDISELYHMMEILNDEFKKRKVLMSRYRDAGVATNIAEYNLINPQKKLPYCYILIDEASMIMTDKTDKKEDKEKKEYIIDSLKAIEKAGRALGMFCIIATQKTVKEEIPPIIKNMSAVRLSFRANDLVSSQVIMESNVAVGLPERIGVYSLDGGRTYDYLFAPTLTTTKLNELLEPYKTMPKTSVKPVNKHGNDVCRQQAKVIPIPPNISYKDLLQRKKLSIAGNSTSTMIDYGGDDFIDY